MSAQHGWTLLARYLDPHGRPHLVVLRAHLVLDLCAQDRPRLVARLPTDEGMRHARALLDGSATDEGYLARARREPVPFIRTLTAADLRSPDAEMSSEPEQSLADLDLAA